MSVACFETRVSLRVLYTTVSDQCHGDGNTPDDYRAASAACIRSPRTRYASARTLSSGQRCRLTTRVGASALVGASGRVHIYVRLSLPGAPALVGLARLCRARCPPRQMDQPPRAHGSRVLFL